MTDTVDGDLSGVAGIVSVTTDHFVTTATRKGHHMSQQVLERPTPTTDLDALRAAAKAAAAQYPPLMAVDRCDASVVKMVDGTKTRGSCGAQAFVRVVMPSGRDLLFCGHCIAENNQDRTGGAPETVNARARRKALIDAGAYIVSEYGSINHKPTDTTPQGPTGF